MDIAIAADEWADNVGLSEAFEAAGEWVVTQVDAVGNVIEETWQDFTDWVESDVADWFVQAGEDLDEFTEDAGAWIV